MNPASKPDKPQIWRRNFINFKREKVMKVKTMQREGWNG